LRTALQIATKIEAQFIYIQRLKFQGLKTTKDARKHE
jgi:hypothetical protein